MLPASYSFRSGRPTTQPGESCIPPDPSSAQRRRNGRPTGTLGFYVDHGTREDRIGVILGLSSCLPKLNRGHFQRDENPSTSTDRQGKLQFTGVFDLHAKLAEL